MLWNMLRSTVDISRPTYSIDASGGQVPTFSVIAYDVPASVQPVSGKMSQYYAERNIEVTHDVFFQNDVGLEMGDIIEYKDQNIRVNSYRNLIEFGTVFAAGGQLLQGK